MNVHLPMENNPHAFIILMAISVLIASAVVVVLARRRFF